MIAGGVSGAVVGGIAGGVSSYLKGENIWTGKANPTSIEPRRPQNPQPDAMPTKANADISMESTSIPSSISDSYPSASSIATDAMSNYSFPVGEGTNSVYLGVDNVGITRYVGITQRNPLERFAEHLRSCTNRAGLSYRTVAGAHGLSRIQARIIEQQLINTYGLGSNGGLLFNKINSISPRYWNNWGITIKIRF